ncbi:MAG: TrkH family potassium uptake protein [Proteobacteria bacterium]|nr:TrkH family potassium uptake protein [Pseudomonadota bacterium]MDA1327003.1 TrkH family potassium uptake protein [Pseudomonadota bacterium]
MQWYGGLVIVILALGLVIESGPAAKRLLGPDAKSDGLVGSTRARVRRALTVYTVLLLAGVVLLMLQGTGPFDALLHSFAAVSTGGFSSRNDSIAGLGGMSVQVAVTALTVFGAISLSLYPTGLRQGWAKLARDSEVRALLLSACAITLMLFLSLVLVEGRSWADGFRTAPLLAFSAQTTSGFEPTRVATLGAASKAILILSMFIGGGAGSTAGGIKIIRLLLILRLVQLLFRRTCLPRHAILELGGGQDHENSEILTTLSIVFLFFIAIVTSWLPFLYFGYPPLDALFEVVSAMGTVGLSSGLTNSALPSFLKAVLCFDMLMGRLEVVAIIILLYPRTWIGRRSEAI